LPGAHFHTPFHTLIRNTLSCRHPDITTLIRLAENPIAPTQLHDGLVLLVLTDEQHARTCNYWYAIRSNGASHTAFTTREALMNWLHECGLKVDVSEIPEPGNRAFIRIDGAYRTAMHLGSYDVFFLLDGVRTKTFSNGQLTMAIITSDEDGLKTVHTLNPNMRDRPIYPHTDLPE
jgi:hypothetical protein